MINRLDKKKAPGKIKTRTGLRGQLLTAHRVFFRFNKQLRRALHPTFFGKLSRLYMDFYNSKITKTTAVVAKVNKRVKKLKFSAK